MKKQIVTISLSIFLSMLMAFNVLEAKSIKTQPKKLSDYDVFYEMTRQIMASHERKIYRNLQSIKEKKEFIEDFWTKRDAIPGTPENEVKAEYMRRVAYVEKWYRERIGKGRGWDSDRGKMYLLLGEPDHKSVGSGYTYSNTGRRIKVLQESWYYDYYGLRLNFADKRSLGIYRITNWSPRVIGAIESARFDVHHLGKRNQDFKFKAAYKGDELRIAIPAKVVSYEKGDGVMEANFNVKIAIYRDYKRIDDIIDSISYVHTQKDTVNGNKINLAIPVDISGRGKYLFDIIVEDATSSERYRDMVKTKI